LGYFKSRDKINMETTITTLIEVMNMVFTRNKIKRNANINLPQQGIVNKMFKKRI
jgi:hypothetical protein